MRVSTDDCRKFIVAFETANPQLEAARFTDEWDSDQRAALLIFSNWKREHKIRPPKDETYSVYVEGQEINRYAEAAAKIASSEIAWERKFNCCPFEGQVAYLVLEKHDGTLLLGNYVGD
jgi:hypothetical protein